MKIELNKLGKRFNREWIFRGISKTFEANKRYAVTGQNGSGKSTFLQVIAGSTTISEGSITYDNIAAEKIFEQVVIVAPYLELIEEMTLTEFFQFHFSFKTIANNHDIAQVLSAIGLQAAAQKEIRFFSSGMKQRVKLAQAFFSQAPVLLLDEPCTNLDDAGVALYRQLVATQTNNKIVLVASNSEIEYDFCDEQINMMVYK
jgi:ABC-type multidrug transport system ATPase subunit